jgi:hypothetical protein
MSFDQMSHLEKTEILLFMSNLKASLRERGLYLDSTAIYLRSVNYGHLGILEDDSTDIVLIEDETDYLELLTTFKE